MTENLANEDLIFKKKVEKKSAAVVDKLSNEEGKRKIIEDKTSSSENDSDENEIDSNDNGGDFKINTKKRKTEYVSLTVPTKNLGYLTAEVA